MEKSKNLTYKDELVSIVFSKINEVKSCEALSEFRKEIEKETNVFFDLKKYPKLQFKLSSKDVTDLKANYDVYLTNPLAKVLYAMAWKQGDLPKLEHIINGILKSEEENISQETALVFYQFGKHLANPDTEPIVDQNILRAFSAYHYKDNVEAPKKKQQIIEYKKWVNEKTSHSETKKEFLYEIDKLLFVVGKAIKKI